MKMSESNRSPGLKGDNLSSRRSGKKKGYTARKNFGEFERELEGLLIGEKLPLGIVVSEVIGPPRVKMPYAPRRM